MNNVSKSPFMYKHCFTFSIIIITNAVRLYFREKKYGSEIQGARTYLSTINNFYTNLFVISRNKESIRKSEGTLM